MQRSERGYAIQADGVNVHYDVHGEGEPLVLLHAGTLTGACGSPTSRHSPSTTA